MADLLETVDKTETLLILVGVAIGGYILYQSVQSFQDWINSTFGIDPSTGNTYANAASQVATNPLGSIGSILGFGQGTTGGPAPNPSGALQPLSTLSSVGYTKIGASGQHWSCSGPNGASNDVCVPVTVDANGNMTTTGAAVPAAQAN